ncbi:hypothetical protein SCHPADRAFT_650109 [Schizopora paradoxa]|uniref:Uncharacterized protein n=1 Tax=Schizopora paradoxa TaxID=27342 RepID=A0A0H2RRJ6_9AGAM|nr:hypothetical protein SCHPADRAFT_650109 [Schizopora paradoxa]
MIVQSVQLVGIPSDRIAVSNVTAFLSHVGTFEAVYPIVVILAIDAPRRRSKVENAPRWFMNDPVYMIRHEHCSGRCVTACPGQ